MWLVTGSIARKAPVFTLLRRRFWGFRPAGATCCMEGPLLRAKFRLDRIILSPSGGQKNPKLAGFWRLWCCQLAAISESWTWVHNCKPSPPYPTVGLSKLFLYSNTCMAFKSVTDRQTDKILNVFGRPGGRWNPGPTKLGKVKEDLDHVLVPLKLLESDA